MGEKLPSSVHVVEHCSLLHMLHRAKIGHEDHQVAPALAGYYDE